MHIPIGSKNAVKIDGARAAFEKWGVFSEATYTGYTVDSGVAEQPRTQEETIHGACTRAQAAWAAAGADPTSTVVLSVGIEDGLIQVPHTETGYMNVCACSLYDGTTHTLGLSSAFEYPSPVMELVLNHGKDISQAFYLCGITSEENIGATTGAIGLLSRGVLNRTAYTIQAVEAALASLESRTKYRNKI